MKLYCGNKPAISIVHTPAQLDRAKHVQVVEHFIKVKLDSGLICTPFVPTDNQIVDILTKGLSNNFENLVSKLGMESIHSMA